MLDGRKLRSIREEKLMTQEELAIRCGMHRPKIAKLEAFPPQVHPRLAIAERLALALGVPIADLLSPDVPDMPPLRDDGDRMAKAKPKRR